MSFLLNIVQVLHYISWYFIGIATAMSYDYLCFFTVSLTGKGITISVYLIQPIQGTPVLVEGGSGWHRLFHVVAWSTVTFGGG